jgi:hypothetical protein
MSRLLRYTALGLMLIVGIGVFSIYGLTWRPQAREALPVSCAANATPLMPGLERPVPGRQALRVLARPGPGRG